MLVLSSTMGLLACGDAAPGIDAGRPDIDPFPYYDVCDPAETSPCPPPYECVEATAGHVKDMICLVPCDADADCPAGYFCNGIAQGADVGAWDHCAENV